MAQRREESHEERESRLLLIRFLLLTDRLLQEMPDRWLARLPNLLNAVHQHLQRIWAGAQRNLRGVIESVRIGLNKARREGLNQIGMFGDALEAKFALVTLDIREGAVRRVLKRLNSMLDSLADIFPALHAVKEYKDHIEATVEGQRDVPEMINLGDLSG
jgi:uncharacterized protein (DUF2267 family)